MEIVDIKKIISSRVSREFAESHGYIVDKSCYPWFGYKGPRFSPTDSVDVLTDLEFALCFVLVAPRIS